MTTPEEVRATDGRVPGRRGIATRKRLLEATAELLAHGSYRDIKVIDIAREAGTSPATFYQYFPDVEHAVMALAEDLTPHGAHLATLVRDDWRGDAGMATARRVVEAFLAYYDGHRAVFRVVDLLTEEGDLRFQRLRTRALAGITDAFRDVIAEHKAEGKLGEEVDPTATAYVLTALLAHVAAHQYGFEFWGVRTATTVETVARILYWTVTGRRPPVTRRTAR